MNFPIATAADCRVYEVSCAPFLLCSVPTMTMPTLVAQEPEFIPPEIMIPDICRCITMQVTGPQNTTYPTIVMTNTKVPSCRFNVTLGTQDCCEPKIEFFFTAIIPCMPFDFTGQPGGHRLGGDDTTAALKFSKLSGTCMFSYAISIDTPCLPFSVVGTTGPLLAGNTFVGDLRLEMIRHAGDPTAVDPSCWFSGRVIGEIPRPTAEGHDGLTAWIEVIGGVVKVNMGVGSCLEAMPCLGVSVEPSGIMVATVIQDPVACCAQLHLTFKPGAGLQLFTGGTFIHLTLDLDVMKSVIEHEHCATFADYDKRQIYFVAGIDPRPAIQATPLDNVRTLKWREYQTYMTVQCGHIKYWRAEQIRNYHADLTCLCTNQLIGTHIAPVHKEHNLILEFSGPHVVDGTVLPIDFTALTLYRGVTCQCTCWFKIVRDEDLPVGLTPSVADWLSIFA